MTASRRAFLESTGSLLSGAALMTSLGCRGNGLLASLPGAVAHPRSTGVDLATHVLSRFTFGPRLDDRERLLALGRTPRAAAKAWFDAQLDPDALDDSACDRALRRFPILWEPVAELYEYKKEVLREALVGATIVRAVRSERQLLEVMVHFWTDHFNIDASKAECAWLKAADDRDVVRRHALGRFRDLLRASALSPAMLWYLDGRENRRSGLDERPNENYARELLELHTLGVHGGYTQQDVMEVARCLTGWTVRDREGFRKAEVHLVPHLHDDGSKRVLGHTIPAGLGADELDRVLDIVADHPSTARHLATKLCRRFIADDPPAPAVEAVAAAFRASGGDVRATLRALYAREELSGEGDAGVARRQGKMKRPFHFVVSALRATGAQTDGGAPIQGYLDSMGHAPFAYPTPDGYPEAPAPWLGTLLFRFKLADALARGAMKGTTIALDELRERAGGIEGLAEHLLGRLPTAAELVAAVQADAASARKGAGALALLLASPGFQRF